MYYFRALENVENFGVEPPCSHASVGRFEAAKGMKFIPRRAGAFLLGLLP